MYTRNGRRVSRHETTCLDWPDCRGVLILFLLAWVYPLPRAWQRIHRCFPGGGEQPTLLWHSCSRSRRWRSGIQEAGPTSRQAFLDGVLAEMPPEKEIHVILDNYGTHKRNEQWLARTSDLSFHADFGQLVKPNRTRLQPVATQDAQWGQFPNQD